MRPVHSGQLARYLGEDAVARVSRAMRGWYGPPIALVDAPGSVWCHGDGEFYGTLRAGYEASAVDRAIDYYRRSLRAYRRACRPQPMLAAGFASLAALITAANAGGATNVPFYKSLAVGGAGELYICAYVANGALATPGNAPGGTVYDMASSGATAIRKALTGEGNFFAGAEFYSTQIASYLIYDHLFGVNKTVSSTTAEAVTGVPTRYQSTTETDWDWAGGNFACPWTNSNATNTAHNWTVCTYADHAGSASTFPSFAGYGTSRTWVSDAIPGTISSWFAPLAEGDKGVQAITQIQMDASSAQARHWMMGHPIGWISSPIAARMMRAERITTAFNVTRISNDACLQFIMTGTGAVTNTFHGNLRVVSG